MDEKIRANNNNEPDKKNQAEMWIFKGLFRALALMTNLVMKNGD